MNICDLLKLERAGNYLNTFSNERCGKFIGLLAFPNMFVLTITRRTIFIHAIFPVTWWRRLFFFNFFKESKASRMNLFLCFLIWPLNHPSTFPKARFDDAVRAPILLFFTRAPMESLFFAMMEERFPRTVWTRDFQPISVMSSSWLKNLSGWEPIRNFQIYICTSQRKRQKSYYRRTFVLL